MLKPKGRAIFFGDRFQALYAFRGAYSAFDDIIRSFKEANYNIEEKFTLKHSKRCPKLHVELAKKINPHIEPMDGALDGVIQ